MADQANIFNDGNTPSQNQNAGGTQQNVPNNDDLATLLGSIKNERGEPKYKSVQDALKALQHSQAYIPELKNNNQALETQLADMQNKLAKMDELERSLQELTTRQTSQSNTPAGLTEQQVAELLDRQLTKKQQEDLHKQNIASVAQTVKQHFGDKAEEVFYGKAAEIGMTKEQFNVLAATNPKAVLKLVGVDGQAQPARQGSQPAFNTAAFQPKQDTKIVKNQKTALIGATTQDLREESANARQMVDELHQQGMSVHDLTDPKVFFKYFK